MQLRWAFSLGLAYVNGPYVVVAPYITVREVPFIWLSMSPYPQELFACVGVQSSPSDSNSKGKIEIRGKVVVGVTLVGTLVVTGRERPLVSALELAKNP